MNTKALFTLTASGLIASSASASLIVYYDGTTATESTSTVLVDQVGGQTAIEDGTVASGSHLYNQASVAAGTYGAITLSSDLTNAFGAAQGSNSYWRLDGGDEDELQNLTNDFTIMAWIFLPSTNNEFNRFIGDERPSGSEGWHLALLDRSGNTNKLDLTGNLIAAYRTDDNALTDGVWQHIAATKSSTGGVNLYVNGILQTPSFPAATGDFNLGSDTWYIGTANGLTDDETADGVLMDEMRVYSTVLDADGIIAAAVPEPGSLALLGLGGLCLIKRRRRD